MKGGLFYFLSLHFTLIPGIDQRYDIFHVPKLVRNACCHCGANFQRLMDASEVVEHEVERQRVAVVFQLL